MTVQSVISAERVSHANAYEWIGRVLTNFALEQAIGELCLKVGLSISNGSLTSLAQLRERLGGSADRKCHALDKRIERWNVNRPFRHLLAHATISCLTDAAGREIVVTRQLPRDVNDVTPDRMWMIEERRELLRQAVSDGRSIQDHVAGLLADPARLKELRV